MTLIFTLCLGIEHWIETDLEIDEDVNIESFSNAPPDLPDDDSSDEREINSLLKWIVTLVSIFQTRFFLTDRALTWLLNFLIVLLGCPTCFQATPFSV